MSVAVLLQEGGGLEGTRPGPAHLDACHRRLVAHALELQLQLRQLADRDGERQVASCVPATCTGKFHTHVCATGKLSASERVSELDSGCGSLIAHLG